MSNLQNIKLGAPRIIRGGACPNATLDVQVASRVDEIDLRDGSSKCTKDGALVSALKVMRQMYSEANAECDDTIKIVPDETTYASVVQNGGSLALSVKEGDIDKTNEYAFNIVRIIEGEDSSLSFADSHTLSSATDKAVMGIVEAIHYATKRKVRKIVFCGVNFATAEQKNAKVIKTYPHLIDDYLLLYTNYNDIVDYLQSDLGLLLLYHEWNPIINSLTDTGQVNRLKGDGESWIDTNLFLNTATDTIKTKFLINDANRNEGIITTSDKFYTGQFGIVSWNSSVYSVKDAQHLYLYCNHANYIVEIEISGKTIYLSYTTDTGSNTVNRQDLTNQDFVPPLALSVYKKTTDYSTLHSTKSIEHVIIERSGEEILHLVPFVRNGEPCMVDLVSKQVYSNSGTGHFTIETT